MKDNRSLSLSLQAAQFAMWELHLYLDTHPEDLSALRLYAKYEEKYHMLKKEYEMKHGSLYCNCGMPGATWLKNPWPWDYEGGRR